MTRDALDDELLYRATEHLSREHVAPRTYTPLGLKP
jgi:hypothetical protein